ncbi:hypothetical protein ACEQ8H_006243 [Pleosporales sp. CAS-2024a]
MWSIVQYRRIGKNVEQAWQARPRGPLQQTTTGHGRDEEDISPPQRSTSQHVDQESSPASQHDQNKSTGGEEFDVTIEAEDDPIDAHNWSLLERVKTMVIVCLLVFTQAWAGSCDSMVNAKASEQYRVSQVAQDVTTAIFLFGIASGCLFTGALSQTFGRNPIYLVFTFAYLVFILGTALSTTFASRIVCRYFAGLFSSAALGINGASAGDMFSPVERALWFPIIAWFNIVPPVLAPIVGGWVATQRHLGWIWTDWIILIMSTFAFVVAFCFLPETNLATLLGYKAKHIRRITRDDRYTSKQQGSSRGGLGASLKEVMVLSVKFSTQELAVVALGVYLIMLYVVLFTFLSGFDYMFKEPYGLDPLQEGACFASIALGATLFTLVGPILYQWTLCKTRTDSYHVRSSKPVQPEFRLWPAMCCSPLLPMSLFWLGWTDSPTISIYSGLAACFCFGIVLNAMYVSSYAYIVDSYGDKAAIALASVTMMRYLVAGGMVMAARPMYLRKLGVHWTMTLLGCVAVILTPAPYALYKYGDKLRSKSPYAAATEGE